MVRNLKIRHKKTIILLYKFFSEIDTFKNEANYLNATFLMLQLFDYYRIHIINNIDLCESKIQKLFTKTLKLKESCNNDQISDDIFERICYIFKQIKSLEHLKISNTDKINSGYILCLDNEIKKFRNQTEKCNTKYNETLNNIIICEQVKTVKNEIDCCKTKISNSEKVCTKDIQNIESEWNKVYNSLKDKIQTGLKIHKTLIDTIDECRNELDLLAKINSTLTILSYNIQGFITKLHGYNKWIKDPNNFYEFIKKHDIFILIDTNISKDHKKEQIIWEKYTNEYDIKWKYAIKSIPKQNCGQYGIVCGIRKSLNNIGVTYKFISYGNEDICIMVKMENIKFNIFPKYIRSRNKQQEHGKELEELKIFIADNHMENPIFIGDINMRFGSLQRSLENLVETESVFKIRNSQDHKSTDISRALNDFLEHHNQVILNGRTNGDREGNCTFVGKKRSATQIGSKNSSIIDICSVPQNMIALVEDFTVDQNTISDHKPLILKLNLNQRN